MEGSIILKSSDKTHYMLQTRYNLPKFLEVFPFPPKANKVLCVSMRYALQTKQGKGSRQKMLVNVLNKFSVLLLRISTSPLLCLALYSTRLVYPLTRMAKWEAPAVRLDPCLHQFITVNGVLKT